MLDSGDRVVVHWHEDQAPGAAESAAGRLAFHMNKPGSGDRVGAMTIKKAAVAAAATSKPPEDGAK